MILRIKISKKIEKSKVLSIYLFLNGELIENISKEYQIISCKDNDKVYGFKEEKFVEKEEFNNIALRMSNNNHSIFSNEQRENFKSKISNDKFLNGIISGKINDINEAIFLIINENLKLIDIKLEVSLLEITSEKISIENIIKFLMKLSTNYESENDFL